MKKRILSVFLCLCMVLSMLPLTAFAANADNHLAVLDTAPTSAVIEAGELYELNLADVFADSEGHSLQYSLSGGDFGEHTKIADGKFAFTINAEGEYHPTISAVCSGGKTVSHTMTITVTEAAEGSDRQYGYEETDAKSVTVYVTISNDGMPILGNDSAQTPMAMKKVTVPYFDLELYGMEEFYRYHTEDGRGSYVDDVVVERPTMLHLFIYLLERYYMGLPEEECCKGTSDLFNFHDDTSVNYLDGSEAYSSSGTAAFTYSGTPTSFFMQEFWGHDLNLKYYRNHAYPLMSDGWGSTADYMLLSDGDAVDVGLFTSWEFYTNGEFCCFSRDAYQVEAGETFQTSILRWDGNTDLVPFSELLVGIYDAKGNLVEYTDIPEDDGTVTVTAPTTPGEYYLIGADYNAQTEEAVNAPAVARFTVKAQPYLSDLHFGKSSSASAEMYTMTPPFSAAETAYTMLAPDSAAGAYAWATLSEYAPDGATITAKWNGTNGQERSVNLTSGKASGQWMAYFLDSGVQTNTVSVVVGRGEDVQTYTVRVVRVQPTLTALSLDAAALNESFSAANFAYSARTTADSVTVQAAARDESYTITYNGEENATIALHDGENVISVKVTNAEGYESVYTITVTKVASLTVSFQITPEDALVELKDSFGERLWAENGKYSLMEGAQYSYTVTKNGYIGQKNTFSLNESGTITLTLEKAAENGSIDTTIYAQWGSFRGENNLGLTDAKTPYAPEDAELLWAAKWGSGWAAAPNPPILVDGDLIVIVSNKIKRVDRNTGEVKAEGTMVGTCGFGIIPPTYGDGMIFVPLSGKVQAFNAKTLESLWVYTDSLGGQPNCPITYRDGYVYVGFWGSETKDANFVCLSVTDEDPTQAQEEKISTWTYTSAGGFYWAGAYASEKYVLVGTDDGQSGYSTESARLLVFDRLTGKLLDAQQGIRGDIRSNVSYDPSSDRFFFTSKGGVLCNVKIDWDTGKITDFQQTVLTDSKGNEYAMSTCTPSVYNDRIYLGVAGMSQFGDFSGHGIAVFDLHEDGTMTNAYVYDIKGYPQTSAMVTTAYTDEQEGYVYIYLPYNTTPGGVSVLKDKKGQTEPLTTTDQGYSEVFTPVAPLSQYCICSTIADEYGTIYYKNDSCYTMALTSKIESIAVTKQPTSTYRNEDGSWTLNGLQVAANLKNGLQRDITPYVTVTKNEENDRFVISYTYGFDHANYGLKTLTTTTCSPDTHPYIDTVVEATCVAEGYVLHTCSLCGYSYRDCFTSATGHDYKNVVTAPTHEKMGYTTHTCTTCGDSYVDSYTEALEHSYTSEVTEEPTCTKEGTMTFTCSCGKSYTQKLPMKAHNYEATIMEPTCTAMGYTTHTCTECGDSYVDTYTEKLEHTYVGEVTKAASCTEEGEMTFTCSCGKSYTQTIAKTAHDYEITITAPDCTTFGYTVRSCKNCDEHVVIDFVQPLGHKEVVENARAATCTETGYSGDLVCERCGAMLREGEEIPLDLENCKTATFTDLTLESWYHKATDFVLEHGYMVGTNDGKFAPDAALTRAQLVTILYRMNDCPTVTKTCEFTDVVAGSYYEKATIWAAENGITNGIGQQSFAPNLVVNREQAVTFFARYAKYLGKDTSAVESLEQFEDADEVSAYAKDAVAWAVQTDLLCGTSNNRLAPKETATRVQAAALIQRLCQTVQ